VRTFNSQRGAGKLFKIDISDFTPEAAVRGHSGASGGPPEVEILRSGEAGVFAARGTLRVSAPAMEVFRRFTDPEENSRIFSRTCTAVNYRELIEEDATAKTRLFEVSKTGRWRLLGIPLSFESTVYALEDWRSLEIRFRLKRPGAMPPTVAGPMGPARRRLHRGRRAPRSEARPEQPGDPERPAVEPGAIPVA